MKSQSYYLPISSNSLPHYFGKAIILPARYFENKVADIQNRANNGILLCTERWVNNTDCSLEVVITDGENSLLHKVSEHFFVFSGPLPISRVKSVYFLDDLQSKTTVWNINNGAAFIPDKLVKVVQQDEIISEDELADVKISHDVSDFNKKAKYYDHLLGGVSLMRISGESYMNYSQNYFPTIGYFNTRIKDDVKKAEAENKGRFNKDLSGVFVKSDSRWGKWQTYLYQNIDAQEVENLAASEGIKIQKKLGILQLESVETDSIIYDLLVLATYGESKSKSIDTFVSDISKGIIPASKKEELALLVGLNNGYSNIRNRYKFSNIDLIVKFELNSQLDYYIIESIFQTAFHSFRDSSSFEYIDEWVTATSEETQGKGAFKIIDKLIVSKKKPQVFSPEYLEEFLRKNSPKEIYQTITKKVYQWIPPFIEKNEEIGESYFENILKIPINNWWKNLINQLKSEYELNIQYQKQELTKVFESEKKELNEKIRRLDEQVSKLKTELEAVRSNTPASNYEPNIIQSLIREKDNEINEKQNGLEDINYLTLHFEELKQIAKERGIKRIPKKKEDLIKAITSIKTFL